jgi:hypothetical protein
MFKPIEFTPLGETISKYKITCGGVTLGYLLRHTNNTWMMYSEIPDDREPELVPSMDTARTQMDIRLKKFLISIGSYY